MNMFQIRLEAEINSVRKCYVCGKPAHLCTCDDEDWEDDGETVEDKWDQVDAEYELNRSEDETDAQGRNFSDADPGL